MRFHTNVKYLCSIMLWCIFIVPAISSYAHSASSCVPGVPCLNYNPGNTPVDNEHKSGGVESCDGNFMNQIYARAFIEAQRENIYNQIYIRKPDSVLAYSCFDTIAQDISSKAPPLFSENPKWQNATASLNIVCQGCQPTARINATLPSGNIQSLINDVVTAPRASYLSSNFGHSAGGGSLGLSGTCINMNSVWQIAKCDNLGAPSSTFYKFSDLISNDYRTLPSACPGTTITDEHLQKAFNQGPQFKRGFKFTYMRDSYIDFVGGISNPDLTSPFLCGPPIETGLFITFDTMVRSSPSASNYSGITSRRVVGACTSHNPSQGCFSEKLCVNPGCYYNQSTSMCANL